MKKIIYSIVLVAISFSADAQLSAILSAWRSRVATDFACTSLHCRTKTVEAWEADSTISLMQRINALISSSSGLCGVLTAGNYCNTALPIVLGNGTDSSVLNWQGLSGYNSTTGVNTFNLVSSGGNGAQLSLHDVSSVYRWSLYSAGLTQNQTLYIPILSSSGYANNALLTAKTPLKTTWYNGSNTIVVDAASASVVGTFGSNIWQITPNSYHISDGTSTSELRPSYLSANNGTSSFALSFNTGIPQLRLDDPISGYGGNLQSGTLTNNRTYKLPDRGGLLQMSGDGVNPTFTASSGAGTGPTITFSATSDDRSGTIYLTTGTSPTAASNIGHLTFAQAYPTNTRVLIQCTIAGSFNQVTTISAIGESTSIFSLAGTLTGSTAYVITYIVQN